MEYYFTQKDMKKIDVIKSLVKKEINGREAAVILGYTETHISRLKQQAIKNGWESLLRKKKTSNRKTKDNIVTEIEILYEDVYVGFNILHFKEKLFEKHNINLSHETIRQILIKAKLHKPKKKRKIYRRRRRMPAQGMLIQMDSSQHKWLDNVNEKWYLIATIDDANSKVPFAYFFKYDGVFPNMAVLKATIEKNGLFKALYCDKASHFTTTRKKGIHNEVKDEFDFTHIERALDELNITLIPANSPQAKGRIERLFGTFQDRLISEMRLRKIQNYNQANEYLVNEFIDYYNERFSIKKDIPSMYQPLKKNHNLEYVFCLKYIRKVRNDNTISFKSKQIQLFGTKKQKIFTKRHVDIFEYENGSFLVWYNGEIVKSTEIKNANMSKKDINDIERYLSKRFYEKERVKSLTF